jgi:outer membrane protein TolC
VKVQTDISRLEEQRIGLRERRDVVLRRIGQLIGRPDAALAVDPVELPLPAVRWDREALEQAAVSSHPRVRAIESRVRADRIWAERRKLESRPDFRVGVGYTSVGRRDDPAAIANPPEDNGKDIVALSAGVNIPIYRQRIRAGVAEARASENADQQLLRDARDRLRYGVQDAATKFDALDDRARLLRDVIIPQAEESLASAEAAYTTNRLGFLDLLDAERVLFQARLSYHRMISDLWIALADLERSLGRAFPEPRTHSMTADRPETGTTP